MTFRKGFPTATAVAFLIWIGHLPSQAQEQPPGLASPPAGSRGETASGGNDNTDRTGILWNMDNIVGIALSRHPLSGQAPPSHQGEKGGEEQVYAHEHAGPRVPVEDPPEKPRRIPHREAGA